MRGQPPKAEMWPRGAAPTSRRRDVVLIDARLPPQKIDLEFMNWCGGKGIPFSLVFTKTDKLSSSALQKNLTGYKKEILKFWDELPPVFVTSSESKFGREPLLNYIDVILKAFKAS